MGNFADTLSERIGPFPAWLWALGVGGGLYAFAHWRTQAAPALAPGTQIVSPPPAFTFGSVGAPMGPALEPNPANNGVNTQPGAANAVGAMSVPVPAPIVSGGDIPTVGGYVGLGWATPYDYARGGPS